MEAGSGDTGYGGMEGDASVCGGIKISGDG